MANTNKGVPYPTSSSNIAPLETHFANLAEGADNTGVLTGTQQFVGPSATAGTVSVTVPFGLTLKRSPVLAVTVQAGAAASSYIATISARSTTQFTAKIYRLNGSGADSNLFLHWMASDYQ
jgi:hypothetical protein